MKTKERHDTPWWWPFGARTLWCEQVVEASEHHHVCERQLHALDRPCICSCGLMWTAA